MPTKHQKSLHPDYETGIVRTDLHCTNCSKGFIAKINMDIDGNHTIVCPYCGHNHYRVITDGQVTGDRWQSSSTMKHTVAETEKLWTNDSLKVQTSTASQFLRDRWLNRFNQT